MLFLCLLHFLLLISGRTTTSQTLNRFLHQAPLVRVALPLILGVILAIQVNREELHYYAYVPLLILLGLLYYRRKQWKYPRNYLRFGVICSMALMICGYSITSLHEAAHEKKLQIPNSLKMGQARLESPLREGSNSIYGTFKLLGYWDGSDFHSSNRFSFIIYASKDTLIESLKPGAEIIFEGEIRPHQHSINPHQFDYATYLERQGIGGSVFIGNKYRILNEEPTTWRIEKTFQSLQLKCIEIFKHSKIGQKERSVLNALVLGYRSELSPKTKGEFADAGVVHVLAVSGLHVGIIYIVFQWLLIKSFGSRFAYLQFVILLVLIWFYAGVTGFSPSVLRASTMFSFIAFGSAGGRKGNTYNMLAASVILLLIINPLIIREVGFQLSYLAVIGIVFFHDVFKQLFWSRYWLIQRAWELLVVSVSAQIATVALSIYYFGQFPNYFFLSNLLVIPLATFSLYSGLLLLIFHSVPFVGVLLEMVADLIVSALTLTVNFFSSLPGSVTSGIQFSVVDVLAFYALIIALILIRQRPNRIRLGLAGVTVLILTGSFIYKQFYSAYKTELAILEGKKGSIALLRSGKEAVFAPLYQEKDGFKRKENQYYIGEFIRKEGIEYTFWIEEDTARSGHYLIYPGLVCFQGDIIAFTDKYKFPSSQTAILLLSADSDFNDFELDKFEHIILDRSFRHYRKKDLLEVLPNDSKVWDMNERGVFRKTYSDFNF